MPFSWFAKRQKKLLFILAAVLIVTWLVAKPLSDFLEKRRLGKAVDRSAMILGEPVSSREYGMFFARWNLLFRGIFHVDTRDATEEEATEMVKRANRRAWAYLAAVKLADKLGIAVTEDEGYLMKLTVFAAQTGQEDRATAVMKGELYQRWLASMRGMDNNTVNRTVVEYIKAHKALGVLQQGVKATTIEAFQDYMDEQRQYRLRYVQIEDEDHLKSVEEPTLEEVEATYDRNSERDGLYWQGQTFEIAYAGVLFSAIEARVKISSAEIEKWYNDNRELLYRLQGETQPTDTDATVPDDAPKPEVKYQALSEVKPHIEASLRRGRSYEQAQQLTDRLISSYRNMEKPSLEDAVRKVKDPAVIYERTGTLTLREIMELPGIGDAMAGGRYFHALVAGSDREKQELSEVLTAPGTGHYVFRLMKYNQGGPKSFDAIRDQIVQDIKRVRAGEASRKTAEDVLGRMQEPDADFVKVAASSKLKPAKTEFFRVSALDPNRPEFITAGELTADSKLVGSLRSATARAWVLAEVIETKESSTEGFADELSMRLASVRGKKGAQIHREIFPDGLLKYVDFEEPQRATESEAHKSVPD